MHRDSDQGRLLPTVVRINDVTAPENKRSYEIYNTYESIGKAIEVADRLNNLRRGEA